MIISFDFDGTLTEPKIRALAKTLSEHHKIIILTSRFGDLNYRDIPLVVKETNAFATCYTNNQEKADWILNQREFDIDIHFDDDFFEIEAINQKTTTIGILVDLSMHPNNTRITDAGLIIPKERK